jgi:hypothetical protein
MPLAANANMIFTAYTIEDGGIRMKFVCSNPGGGEPSDYDCFLTDAELTGTANLAALRTLVTTKLSRRYRATGLTAKLDPLIGQQVTI